MAYQIVEIDGRTYVRIPTKYITIQGRKVYAHEHGLKCFFINIPIEKFNFNRYGG